MRELWRARGRALAWRRGLLAGLVLAVLAGGWLVLAPGGEVLATGGRYTAHPHLKYGDDIATCPGGEDTQAYVGEYVRAGTTVSLRMKDSGRWDVVCSPANALSYFSLSEWAHAGVENHFTWLLELRTAAGSEGQLISGANIQLPASFGGARSGVHNSRSGKADNTGNDGRWPQESNNGRGRGGHRQVYSVAEITFTVPSSHSGDVYLRWRMSTQSGAAYWNTLNGSKSYADTSDFSFRFSAPLSFIYPLPAPQDSGGTPSTADLSGNVARPAGGTRQRARLFIRQDPATAYISSDANIASSDLDSATIKLTSDAAGATAITGATITDSGGSAALSACTEATAGDTCTVTSANWPATDGTTTPLDIWFTFPASHSGAAYLQFSASGPGRDPRNFTLPFLTTTVSAHPLAAPQNSGGTITTGKLSTASRSWIAGGSSQRAAVFLRDADPEDEYDSADSNAAPADFDEGVIVIAADPGGSRPIEGAEIGDSSGDALTACTETTAGDTCTITSANWPESSGATTQVDIYFTVPDTHDGPAYVAVKADKAGEVSRSYGLKYDAPPQVAAHPLAAPMPTSTVPTWDLSKSQQRHLPDADRQQARIFLRSSDHGNRYDATDTNAASSAFDSVTIRLASSAAGTTGISNAKISDSSGNALSACTETAAGNLCTITSANWPASSGTTTQLDVWIALPDGRTAPAYLVVTAAKSGERKRVFSIKYDAPFLDSSGVWHLGNSGTYTCARGRWPAQMQILDAGKYVRGGATTVTLNPRYLGLTTSSQMCTAAVIAAEDQYDMHFYKERLGWKVAVNAAPGDSDAQISGAAVTMPTGLTRVTAARSGDHPLRSDATDSGTWPFRQGDHRGFWRTGWGYSSNSNVSFTIPADHEGPVYLYVWKQGSWRLAGGPGQPAGYPNAGDAETTFVFQPGVAANPLAVPLDSGGSEETGDLTEGERVFAANGDSNRVRIFPRRTQVNEYDAGDQNAQRSGFDNITIRVATAEGGSTSVAGATITQADGTSPISACSEAAAGPLCTITSANWPQASSGTPLRTLPQDIYFTVPNTAAFTQSDDSVWLVVEATESGSPSSKFSIEYENPYIQAFPFLAPAPGGTVDTGNVQMGARTFLPNAGINRAKAYIRAAAHSDQLGSGLTNANDDTFTTAVLRIATSADGTTAAAGSYIAQSDGSSVPSECNEGTAGPTCTITAANWPDTSNVLNEYDIWFSAPALASSPVFLTLTLQHTGKADRVYAIQYDVPLAGYPLPVPQDSGGTLDTGLLDQTILRPNGGTQQRARVFLREADHGNRYVASHANVRSSRLTNGVIKLTSDSAGQNLISGATISQSDGTSALAACTESTPGNTCTVTSANWPAASGRTTGLDIWFQFPATHSGTAYLHVTMNAPARTPNSFALEYGNPVAVFPLPVPQNSGGTPSTEDLVTTEREFVSAGNSQRARIYLRDANRTSYNAAHANVARSAFGNVRIRIASDASGNSPVANAKISSDAGGNTVISACTETSVGHTCNIASASFPQNSATPPLTTHQDIRFSVPSGHSAPVFLVVTVTRSGTAPRTFATEYQVPTIDVHPLIAEPGATDGTVLTAQRRAFTEGDEGGQRALIHLRDQARTTYVGSHANVARSAFDSVTITVTSDAAGTSPIGGALIGSNAAVDTVISACTESTVGNTCTITSASWGQTGTPPLTTAQSVYFKLSTSGRTSPVWLAVTVSRAGFRDRTYTLKFPARPQAFPHVVPRNIAGDLPAAGEDFSGFQPLTDDRSGHRASIFLGSASGDWSPSITGAPTTRFDSVRIWVSGTWYGSNLSGAVLSTDAAGSNPLTGCTEGATPGPVCTIPAASWPATAGVAGRLDLYFSVPAGHSGRAYLSARVLRTGDDWLPRGAYAAYQPAVPAHPLIVPDGTATGTNLAGGTRDFDRSAPEQATVHLRAAGHGGRFVNGAANAARADFTAARIRIATDAAGDNALSGAVLSSDSAGNTAISACTETTAGHTCNITSANWPQSSGGTPTTTGIPIYVTLPSGRVGDVYVVLSVDGTNLFSRSLALRYDDPHVQAFPIAVPAGNTGAPLGASTGVDLGLAANQPDWLPDLGAQYARVRLLNAAHADTYDASDAAVSRSRFDSATIRLASDAAGATEVAGAEISALDGSVISACTEATAGPTCTITTANWPSTSAQRQWEATHLALRFTVPASHDQNAPVYLVVTTTESDRMARRFALRYNTPFVQAFPLAVPQTSDGTLVADNLLTASREFADGGRTQRARIFLRAAPHGDEHDAADANAVRATFDFIDIVVGSKDMAGTWEGALSGAVISSNAAGAVIAACNQATAGNECRITAANWPQATAGTPLRTLPLDLYFSVPDSTSTDVYLRIDSEVSGKRHQEFELKYEPFLQIWPLAVPAPGGTRETGNVRTSSRNFAAAAAVNQVELYLRDASHAHQYDAAHAGVPRGDFDDVVIRIATEENGDTSVDGAQITNAAGTGALAACDETAPGPVCTIDDNNWSETGGATVAENLYFTVPDDLGAEVWLVMTVEKSGEPPRVYSIKYDDPYVSPHPLVVPFGSADGTDVSGGAGNFAGGAGTQRVTAYIRAAAHSSTYTASATNANESAFTQAVIKITSDAAGQNPITNAVLSSDSAGSTAISGCTQGTTAGNTCTITIANWPDSSGVAGALSFYFSVPVGTQTPAYAVVEVENTGQTARAFGLRYDPGLLVYPLVVPSGVASGNTVIAARQFAAANARQEVAVHLRDVWHSNDFDSADANTERSDFDSAEITIATDTAGANPAAGAQIYALATGTGRPAPCTMSDNGATCTIAASAWPQDSGSPPRTQGVTLHFSVPNDLNDDVHLVVNVVDGAESRRFSLRYDDPLAGAFPLAVPSPGGSEEAGNLKTPARSFARDAGTQRMKIFLRDAAHGDEFDSGDANARDDAFDSVTIELATTSSGGTAVTGGILASDTSGSVISACTEATAGPLCTITAANWPDTSNVTDALDLYWSVPDATNADVFLVVKVIESGKTDREFFLRYKPGLPIFPLVVPSGTSTGTDLTAVSRDFAQNGATQQAEVNLRAAAHSGTYTLGAANAAKDLFDSVVVRVAADAGGQTGATGAVLSSNAAGTTALSGCTEGSAPGHTCTIPSASWPGTGASGSLNLHFSVPHDRPSDVHLVISVKKAGQSDRVFALPYLTPLAPIFPLAVPEDAGGNLETGDLKAPTRVWAREGALQRARIFLRAAAHADAYDAAHANGARAAFSTAVIRIATDANGANELSGAEITASGGGVISNCTQATAGPTCTINGGTAQQNVWLIDSGGLAEPLDLRWSVPTDSTSDAYLVVTVNAPGKQPRRFSLKYDANLPVFPLAMPSGTATGTDLAAGSRDYAAAGAAQQFEVNLRNAAHSDTYTSTETNAQKNLFQRVVIRIASDSDGTTEAAGTRIAANSAGTTALAACNEAAPGPTCTITSANWPDTAGVANALSAYFSVPLELGADVHLTVLVERDGHDDRFFSLQYGQPYVAAFPLAAPIIGGAPESGDLTATSRSFADMGQRQQVRLFLRDAWHDNEFDAMDTNAADAAFTQVEIRIATAAGGSTSAANAVIYNAASGADALAPCTETTAGALCTITAANLPDTGGVNAPLDFWFSVPNNRIDTAWVVVTVSHATSGATARVFSLRYDPGLPVFPIAVPRTPTDGYESGNLGARTGAFAGNFARQKATVFLRAASHGNMWANGQSNVDQSDAGLFDSVTLSITTAADGNTLISGARFYGSAGGAALQGCSSNTCTINRADWPSAGGLDLWFAVPDSRLEDSYLHVAVNKAGEPSRETATRYETSYVRAYQLIVPKTGASSYEAGTLATNTRRWLPEGGDQRAGVFLREQPRSSYVAGHANAPVTNFDSAVITITSDAAGNSPLANAEITSDGSSVLSACTESTAGNTCTVAVANWPQSGSPALATELDFQFSVPDSHQAAAYVHVALTKSGKTNRGGSLRWQPPLFVAAFPRAQALDDGGAPVTGAVGEYDAKAGTDRARISVRANQAGTSGAPIANFDRVIITITSDAAGASPISGAVLASNAAGNAAISACNEATAGNTCTVPAASWPVTGAAADDLDLYFSIPLAHGTDAYIFVRTENAGERDRVAALKFDAPSGALSNSASAVLDPRLSDGTRERDDDGDGDRLDNQRWYSTSASDRQRLGVRIYENHRNDWSGSAELASFASLASTNALILTAHYTVGQTGTNLGATHIEFTQPDGTALGCTGTYNGGSCTLTRTALKALMGVTGAADARRSFEFEFAFSIKAAFTNTADITIQAQVNRHTGNSWNAEAVYSRGVAAASNAQPFAMQLQSDGSPEQGDVVARDPQRRYAPGGQATPVNLRIYDAAAATTTYSASASLVSYSTISEVKLELKDRPSPNALIPGAAITALQNDGSTSACSEAMPGNVCTITAANYLASGPPRAAGYYRALPLDFTFTVPAGYTNSDFGNADLVITVVRTGSGTLSQRTRTFTLPFDGGTRAEPFAMAANAAFDAPADNQQWAAAGARTPVWLHVYNVAKSAYEMVSGTNTAQYWEFDQTAGVNVIEIELLDGQSGSAAPPRARITAPDSDEKFAPCTEERPGPTCTITLAALKAYDSAATTDDDYVDPLRFAVSLPQGSTDSIRIKATVQRSDDVPGQSVKERKTGEFALYAPWPYPLLAPVDQRGDPPAGEIGDTSWEYEPRGQRTPLLLRLYNARQPGAYLAPTSANMAALADFETVTLTVLDQDGAALTGARISARSGAALAACRPASHSCEITRAEWRALQPGASSLASAALAFSVIVPASHGEAVAVRAEIKHSGRNAPIGSIASDEDIDGTIKTGIANPDADGNRTSYYELRMVSPVKKAWALALLDDEDGDGLRLCRQGETCTASAQQGAALGFAAAISRGLGSHPAKQNPDQDELVQYDEVDQLTITAVDAEIIHRALCPPSTPLHPLDPALPATADDECTIPGPLLQAFHGAQPSDPIRPLELALVPQAASGTVTVAYDIAGSDDVIRNTDESQPPFQFSAAAGSPRLAATAFFDWTDPGSDYANARPALILAVGRADSRTDAPPVPASALPGGLVPATFAELHQDSALQLAISLGSITFNGRACPEDDAADGCALQLSRADLLAASPATAPSEPISGLRVEYFLPLARNGPTTLTVTARPDGGAPVSGSLAIPHPAVSAPEGAAFLPADADGRIAPGATEELAAGFLFAVADSGPGWACLRMDPSFLELDQTGAAVSACTLSRAPAPAAGQDQDPPGTVYAWLAQGSYLALGGDAAFADGGKRLRLGGDSPWNQLRCGPADGITGLAASGSRDLVCWVSDADGQRPRITASASPSGNPVSVSASLIPARGRRFQFLLGDGAQPTDRHAPAAAITIPGAPADGSLFGSAAIPAGAAALPASAALVRAGDATGPVPDGATANLLLRINAADGRPADRERISSITITAGKGELGGPYCPNGGRACTFHARDGSALAIAADGEPGLTARIPITLDPPDGEGSLQLRAVVVSAAGARLSASLDLDYAGAAALIRIGEDLPVLHHHATSSSAAGAGAGAGSGSASTDNRDNAMIPITATDRGGRVVALPLRASASITGPDGAAQDNFNIARDCSDGPTACKFRVAVTAGSSTPLPSGRYQLVVQAAGIPDATAEFGVAGPAATIEAETPTLPALGAPLAIRAQITDQQGNAVADGTQVRLSIRTPDGSPTPLIPLDPPPPSDDPAAANLKTKNGIAAATLVSASSAIAILSLNAQDGATTPASLTLVLTPTDASDDGTGADGTGDGAAAAADAVTQSGFSTWSGRTGATAAAALAASPNMQAIYLWNGKRWLRYAASPSGAPVPGSQNFPLLPGDLIFSPQ